MFIAECFLKLNRLNGARWRASMADFRAVR
jgi:hypothetical protein